MIEIIATIYIVSFCLSMGLVAWNYLAVSKEVHSKTLQVVNSNLQKIGFFWSMTRENFASLQEFSIEADAKAAKRSTLLLGLLGLLSALGFILLLAITITLRFLKSNRRSRAVFHSDLAKNQNLDREEVQNLYQEFSQIH